MKKLSALAALLIACLILYGCANSPQVTADQAAITAATTQATATVNALNGRLLADEAALSAAINNPTLQPQVAALQVQVQGDHDAITAAKLSATTQAAALQSQLATDESAAKIQSIQSGVAIGQAVGGAAPAPWGWIIAGVVGIAGAVATAYQTSGKLTAQNVIAAAAPGVAHLVGQATDNTVLETDIKSIAQVAPGVIALLAHPAAVSAAPVVAAAPPVASAVAAAKV